MDSISHYHSFQRFRSKSLFHGQIYSLHDHENFKSQPMVISEESSPHWFRSPPLISHTWLRSSSIQESNIGHSEPWHNLPADLTPLHSTSDLTWEIPDEDYWLLSLFPLYQKLLTPVCVTFFLRTICLTSINQARTWPL